MYACPICGSNSYSRFSLEEIYQCGGCSILFSNPEKFGKITNIKPIKQNNEVRTHPTTPGVVVSEPIKLRKLK